MFLFDTDTIITISKIVYGAEKVHSPKYHLNNLESILLPAVNIVGFDTKAAYVCGRIRAELEKRGTPLYFSRSRNCIYCNCQ